VALLVADDAYVVLGAASLGDGPEVISDDVSGVPVRDLSHFDLDLESPILHCSALRLSFRCDQHPTCTFCF